MKRILIGGSPCTHWSIAQKNNRETEPQGEGWELFKNYLIAKEKFKPDFFLYENNKSAAQPIKDQISRELEVPLQYINSALVSAQNRQRFYAHNIPSVPQPEDRGILLKDILESGVVDREKSYYLKHQAGNARDYFKKHHTQIAFEPPNAFRTGTFGATMISEPVRVGDLPNAKGLISGSQATRIYSIDGKNVNLVANGGGQGAKTGLYAVPYENVGESETVQKAIPKLVDKLGYVPEKFNAYNVSEINDKSPTLSTGSMVTSSCATTIFEKTDKPVYEVRNGLITIKGKQYPIKLPDGYYIIRKLTVTECCRLQTMPDDYCRAVSATQGYKGLGNGWTAEVIIHILKHMNIPLDEEIEILSMYDGIGTGRYCFDKMGYKNIKYYAYEIDKYPIQVAMSNYDDIIQCGDAFDVRSENWSFER